MKISNRVKIVTFCLIISMLVGVLLNISCVKKQKNVIKIGVLLPLSGEASTYGKEYIQGIQVAKKDFERNNPIKIKLYVEDTEGRSKIGMLAFQKLVNVDKIKFFVGPAFSTVALTIAPFAVENNILIISPGVSSTKFVKMGKALFSIYPSSKNEALKLSDYCDKKRIAKLGVLYSENPAMKTIVDIFSKNYKGKILINERYKYGKKDFKNIIAKLKAHNLKNVLIAGYRDEVGMFTKQINNIGYTINIFSISTLLDEKFIQDYGNFIENIIFTAPYLTEEEIKDKSKNFYEEYFATYHTAPTLWSALGYDAINLLLSAIRDNDYEENPTKISEILLTTPYIGVIGRIEFDKYGAIRGGVRLWTVKNGEFIPVEF